MPALFITTHNMDFAETIYTNGVLPLKTDKDFAGVYHNERTKEGKINCNQVVPSENEKWGQVMVDFI